MNIEIVSFVNATYGRQYPAERWFEWSTDVVFFAGTQRKSQRNQLLEQPIHHWLINWQALLQEEKSRLLEIFNRAKGQYGTFLISDDEDYECALSDCSYTAAGGETLTQLIKTYYNGTAEKWTEKKKKIKPGSIFPPVVKINGAVKTEDVHFTLDDSTGIIDWTGGSSPNGALTTGQVVTANYQFYFNVRFDIDIYKDTRNLPKHWQQEGVHLIEDE